MKTGIGAQGGCGIFILGDIENSTEQDSMQYNSRFGPALTKKVEYMLQKSSPVRIILSLYKSLEYPPCKSVLNMNKMLLNLVNAEYDA